MRRLTTQATYRYPSAHGVGHSASPYPHARMWRGCSRFNEITPDVWCSPSLPSAHFRAHPCGSSRTTSLLTGFGFERMEMVRWWSSCSQPKTSPSLLMQLLRPFRICKVEYDHAA